MERLPSADHAAPTRIYAVGDIHGEADRLARLHDAIATHLAREPSPDPLLIHLGDSIDRGPDSARCIGLLANGPPIPDLATVNLMGNHERMMLDALSSPEGAALWLHNGGARTLESFGLSPYDSYAEWGSRIPDAALAFMRALPLVHATERFVFVHAGVRPGIRLSMQTETDLLWIRSEFLNWAGTMLPDAPDKLIVHGHTPTEAPVLRRNRLGIDTGAVRGGKLTCAVLETDSVYFLQV